MKGWTQQYLQEQYAIVKKSGSAVSLIGITFILGTIQKFPLAPHLIHLLSKLNVLSGSLV